jgi:hypothetical protein
VISHTHAADRAEKLAGGILARTPRGRQRPATAWPAARFGRLSGSLPPIEAATLGAGAGKIWKAGTRTLNAFVEPQWTVAHDGDGFPKFTLFFALDTTFGE